MFRPRTLVVTAVLLAGLLAPLGAQAGAAAPCSEVTVAVGDIDIRPGRTGPNVGGFFPIVLDKACDTDIVVSFATEGDPDHPHFPEAIAGVDYLAKSGTVTIEAGRRQATVSVFAKRGTPDDDPTSFNLRLTGVDAGATIVDSVGNALILVPDDDAPQTSAYFGNAVVPEGDEASRVVWVNMVLNHPATEPTTVSWIMLDGGATLTQDYRSMGSSVVFQPGQLWTKVPVRIMSDTVAEGDEEVNLLMMTVSPGQLGYDTHARIVIRDDD